MRMDRRNTANAYCTYEVTTPPAPPAPVPCAPASGNSWGGTGEGGGPGQPSKIGRGPPGLGSDHPRQGGRGGGGPMDGEVVAGLGLGAFGRRVGGGEQGRAADIAE